MTDLYKIFDGLGDEANLIFKSIIDRFNLYFENCSDYRIILRNDNFGIEIYNEFVLQYLLIDIPSQRKFFLTDTFKYKGLNTESSGLYSDHSDRKKQLIILSKILHDNYESEFLGKYDYRERIILEVGFDNLFFSSSWDNDEEIRKLNKLYFEDKSAFVKGFKDYLKTRRILPEEYEKL